MFAIVRITGKQYKVSKNASIDVDRLDGEVGSQVTFPDVLLVNDDKKVTVGTPTVKGVTVKAKITDQGKGEKIQVRRFKSKVRYRRQIGFRAAKTTLEIVSIGA